MAVQAFVAQSAGVPLEAIALTHIDNSWVYPGNEDYRGLLKENDLTAEAFSRTDEVKGWIAQAQSIAASLPSVSPKLATIAARPLNAVFTTIAGATSRSRNTQSIGYPAFPRQRQKSSPYKVSTI